MRTLKEFLKKHEACEDGYLFAKDLTLEQFLDTCPRGDWILWLFARTNPRNKKLRVLTGAHCANTVRHLMTDQRSIDAVDTAIKYGEGKCSIDRFKKTAADAARAAAYADDAARSAAANAAAGAADAAAWAAANAAADANDARKKNQLETANICRQYLPLEIWNQSKI